MHFATVELQLSRPQLSGFFYHGDLFLCRCQFSRRLISHMSAAKLFSFKLWDETPERTEFVSLQRTNLNMLNAYVCAQLLLQCILLSLDWLGFAQLLSAWVIHFCSCLVNIHILDYPDSPLSRSFYPFSLSPDNGGLTVLRLLSLFLRQSFKEKIFPFIIEKNMLGFCREVKRSGLLGNLEKCMFIIQKIWNLSCNCTLP